MTIKFDTKAVNLIGDLFNEHATYTIGSEINIFVYSGTQPTIANYEANWTTNYFIDSTGPTYGSDLLCTYGYVNSGTDNSDYIWNEQGGTPYTYTHTDSTYTSVHVGNGTATWGVIWNDAENYSNGDTAFPTTRPIYMIVPVSSASGTGVIKLASTTISGSAPTISSVDLTFAKVT